ncbi:hypothetical protein THAOC_05791, partial [Thalassiosira oceanica]
LDKQGRGWGNDLRLGAGTAPADPRPPRRPPAPEPVSQSGGRLGRVQEDEGAFGRYGAVKVVGSTRRRDLEDEDDPSRRGRVASPEKRALRAARPAETPPWATPQVGPLTARRRSHGRRPGSARVGPSIDTPPPEIPLSPLTCPPPSRSIPPIRYIMLQRYPRGELLRRSLPGDHRNQKRWPRPLLLPFRRDSFGSRIDLAPPFLALDRGALSLHRTTGRGELGGPVPASSARGTSPRPFPPAARPPGERAKTTSIRS